MGVNYLFDTNAAIELSKTHQKGYENEVQSLFRKIIGEGSLIFYSVITQTEFLSGKDKVQNPHFIEYFSSEENEEFIPVTSSIAKTAGNLRHQLAQLPQSVKIKTPDSLILATALEHRLVLVTADTDFKSAKMLGVQTFKFKPLSIID